MSFISANSYVIYCPEINLNWAVDKNNLPSQKRKPGDEKCPVDYPVV